MRWLDQLDRKFGRYGVPNVTIALIVGQVAIFFLIQSGALAPADLELSGWQVRSGQIWRLFTFVLRPPDASPIFLFFAWYLFWLMGGALESEWGTFRYNLFLLFGWLGTVVACMVVPTAVATNGYIGTSVFLAFALLYPNFQLMLFFILPVAVKWLALIACIGLVIQLIVGGWHTRLFIGASLLNMVIFFWHDFYLRVRAGQFTMATQARRIREANVGRHKCSVCGITDREDRTREFRYDDGPDGTEVCICEQCLEARGDK